MYLLLEMEIFGLFPMKMVAGERNRLCLSLVPQLELATVKNTVMMLCSVEHAQRNWDKF
jgi:hypothetical protein